MALHHVRYVTTGGRSVTGTVPILNKILEFMQKPRHLGEIMDEFELCGKETSKHVDTLLSLGLVSIHPRKES